MVPVQSNLCSSSSSLSSLPPPSLSVIIRLFSPCPCAPPAPPSGPRLFRACLFVDHFFFLFPSPFQSCSCSSSFDCIRYSAGVSAAPSLPTYLFTHTPLPPPTTIKKFLPPAPAPLYSVPTKAFFVFYSFLSQCVMWPFWTCLMRRIVLAAASSRESSWGS